MVFNFTYLALDLAVASTLLFALAWKQFRPVLTTNLKPVLAGIGVGATVFILWDIWATAAGHWSFNSKYTLGFGLLGLPLEEWLFFVCIPMACMVIYLFMRKDFSPRRMPLPYCAALQVLVALPLLAVPFAPTYTKVAIMSSVMVASWLVWQGALLVQRRYWLFMAVVFGLFFMANSILASLPIIIYNSDHILGLRIGFIPVEDFLYNFALINLVVLVYEVVIARKPKVS